MKKSIRSEGEVFIIPSPIGNNNIDETLPVLIKKTIAKINHYIVENKKISKKFINKICPEKRQEKIVFFELNRSNSYLEIEDFIKLCSKGLDIGILSDAGCPCIADPGSTIIDIAHKKNLSVRPLVGPSSILLALISSGMNAQNFTFNGYLSRDKNLRKKNIFEIEKRLKRNNETQVLIETPYRNNQLLDDLLKYLSIQTKLCLASNLTDKNEQIRTLTINEWRSIKNDINIKKSPTIFLVGQ